MRAGMTTHENEAARLRRELKQRGRTRGKRFDPELRARMVAFAESRRRDGASWMAIATELGACFETVRRWCVASTPTPALRLRPVEVVSDDVVVVEARGARTLTVISPGGLRIEGAGVDEVVALVRALG